ncbi:hypothetical protein [Streptomyces bauhiniae]
MRPAAAPAATVTGSRKSSSKRGGDRPEELDEFNAHLVGRIEVVHEFR